MLVWTSKERVEPGLRATGAVDMGLNERGLVLHIFFLGVEGNHFFTGFLSFWRTYASGGFLCASPKLPPIRPKIATSKGCPLGWSGQEGTFRAARLGVKR